MKKLVFVVLSFLCLNNVFAEERVWNFFEYYARYNYTFRTPRDVGVFEFFTFHDEDTNNEYYALGFMPLSNWSFFKKDNITKYKRYEGIETITEEQIKDIENIIFWGSFLDEGNNFYWRFATQLYIFKYLSPEIDFYASDQAAVRLDYLDEYLDELDELLAGRIKKLDSLSLELGVEKTILINLDNFEIRHSGGIEVNYSGGELRLKANETDVYLEIESVYSNDLKPHFVVNYSDQTFILKNKNIDFYKKYEPVVLDISEDEKTNPVTGSSYTTLYKVLLITPLLVVVFIPVVVTILIKMNKNQ